MKKMLMILAVGACLSGCYDMGQTSIKGYIVKMDGEGLVWRTMEAKIMEGSLNSGHVSDEITVPPDMVEAFSTAMDTNSLVKVTFRRELLIAPWRGSTDRMAVKIEKLEAK